VTTLAEDIAALAQDRSVMWAAGVLRDRGINGVMYEKLLALTALRKDFTRMDIRDMSAHPEPYIQSGEEEQ
jgi:hypothetical protein